MKYLSIFLLATLLSSCCSTKKTIDITSKPIAEATETSTNVNEGEFEAPKESSTVDSLLQVIPKIPEPPKPPAQIADTISREKFNHTRWDRILQNYVSDSGQVNYQDIKNNSGELIIYIDSLGEKLPQDDWSNEDKLAYWINAYNALTIDLIIKNYPVKSIKDIKDPWKQRYWKLGDKWYNLDEIEHQIIRKMGEPRIHFALVCAAVSCPKLYNKAFKASSLNEDLSKLTREFLADETKNNISQNNLRLSKIFSWFAKDFKQDGSLIDFLNQYSDIEISDKVKKRFNTYNWDLNE